ncbi:hypothetical protein PR048_012889 [Dryococelus australis]|uniref:DDE-1 domain-containing protein n=1 Tax=Dryococelus australis TaxID=614101 RepID=A0ABQ9HQP1_9NEOP|nr:hypothetical protein PR048_012889 [Dryococelus australis]
MEKTIQEVALGSFNYVASKYNILYATLYRHVKSGSAEKTLGRFRTVFKQVQKNQLVEYLQTKDNLFSGMTRDEFKKLAYDIVEGLEFPILFKIEALVMNCIQTYLYVLQNLLQLLEVGDLIVHKCLDFMIFCRKHQHEASRIINMDETGIKTTTNKSPKMLSIARKKQVGTIASTERGKLTTAVCCCNAIGSFIPPFNLFARKLMQARILDGFSSVAAVSSTSERKVMLILDNYESHKYIEALDFAKENNIWFLSFAPHMKHRMQPLIIAVYGP